MVSPSLISVEGPKRVIPTLSSSRLRTIPCSPLSNFTNSPYCAFDSPKIRAIPSPTCNTVPTSSKEALASKCANCSFKIAEISAAFISAIFSGFKFLISPVDYTDFTDKIQLIRLFRKVFPISYTNFYEKGIRYLVIITYSYPRIAAPSRIVPSNPDSFETYSIRIRTFETLLCLSNSLPY